jgi:hypothetical protein
VQPGRILASARKLSNSAEQFVARGDQLGSGKIVEFREYTDALARRSPTLSPSGLSDLISRPQTR